jgi:pilus assembly protein TadC
VTTGFAAGLFLTAVGLVALSFGLYALLRGGRDRRGGIGPLSERGIHVIAGVRMTLIGLASLGFAAYLFWRG